LSAGEKIEQTVTIKDHSQAGDITLIGKIVKIVLQPSAWQDATWRFLSTNRRYSLAAACLVITITVIYLKFQALYLIPLWKYALSILLALTASWGWYRWGWHGRGKSSLFSAFSTNLLLVILIGWQAWKIAYPSTFSPPVYGIALAELGEGAGYTRTARAREIGDQVFEHLCRALNTEYSDQGKNDFCTNLAVSSTDQRVELRRIGVISNSRLAQVYGKQIGADIVIWGNLLTVSGGGATIRFQVIETPDQAVNPDYPLIFPITTQETDIFAGEFDENDPLKLKNIVANQSTLISLFTLGVVAYLDSDFPDAVRTLENGVNTMKTSSELSVSKEGRGLLYYYLGEANLALGRIEIGLDWLDKAQKANPSEPAVMINMALGNRSLGRIDKMELNLDQALELIEKWLTLHPDDNKAIYERGIVHQMRRQFEDALVDYQQVLSNDDHFLIAYISSSQASAALGHYHESEKTLKSGIALAQETGANASWLHLNLALVYDRWGKIDSARIEYARAVELDPQVDWMVYFQARFLGKQGETDAALASYRKLIEVTSNKGWAYGQIAAYLMEQGLKNEALENYKLAVHEKPDDGTLRAALAKTYYWAGDEEKAVQEFEEAIRRDPDNYYTYGSYANVLFDHRDYFKAAQMYEKALRLHPKDFALLLNLGNTYEVLGQPQKAKEIYFQILNTNGDYPERAYQAAREHLSKMGITTP